MVSKRLAFRVRIPDELKGWVNNRLVNAHIRSVQPMALGILLNLVISLLAVWGHVSTNLLIWIAAATIIGLVQRIRLAGGLTQRRRRNPARLVWAFELNSLWLGAHAGVLVAVALPLVSGAAQLILVLSAATQLGALAYTNRTLPRAAIVHIGLIGAGLAIGLFQLGGLLPLAGIVLICAANLLEANMIQVAHKAYVDRILREREVYTTSLTVKMLLNDYEAQGSDWIFELDHEGRMVSVSDRFAASTGRKAEEMNGRAFVDLFAESSSRKELLAALESGQSRRALTLKLAGTPKGESRWWSISLRPLPPGLVSVAHFRGVISDISSEKQAEARVYRMANYDSLTELPNRLMFNASLGKLFSGEIPYSRIALLIIDCDHFKQVNDMYGHPVGDKFLRLVAARLEQTINESGLGSEGHILARLGGDEFAILLSGEDVVDQSVRLADCLVAAFAEPFIAGGHEVNSGISIGMALAPDHAISAEALMSQADIALYVAKEEGRGRWEMFQSGMDEELHRRHALARDLRTAVANGELRLFLQPLVNVETRQQTGFEALMRWQHPERGMVMPNDFIPIAEETGLIVPMGEWMIREALSEAASWNEPHSIAINLSPIQLRSPNLIPTVINALAVSGIDPGRVELEITESVLMNNSEENIVLLNQLHDLGVKVALDDFGTGYASLNYLLTFPFDKIKIDRSFVNDLESREESRAIVAAVISLANRLGMCTLAEGVEHESQLAKLREQGCEMVQGWLFGKAEPAGHYADLSKPDTRRAA